METPGRRTDRSVENFLFDHGYNFEFFQAVRLLLRIYQERAPLGKSSLPASEVVRFHARQSLAFPPSPIYEVEPSVAGRPSKMTIAFMGLIGPQGMLPVHYTEGAISRTARKEKATAAFLDLFHHRLVSLFYRAWEKHHFIIAFERERFAPRPTGEQGFTQYLFHLIGMGTEGLRNRLQFRDEALLLYAGLLAQRPHSAVALTSILIDYFRIPVAIEQFRGKWFPLSQNVLSYLQPEGSHNELGLGAIAGDAVWNPQARFRLRLGPLNYRRFAAFLPGGRALTELMELVSYIVGSALEFDIQLILIAKDVPPCLATDDADRSPMLGLTSWLDRESVPADADDLILEGARQAA